MCRTNPFFIIKTKCFEIYGNFSRPFGRAPIYKIVLYPTISILWSKGYEGMCYQFQIAFLTRELSICIIIYSKSK